PSIDPSGEEWSSDVGSQPGRGEDSRGTPRRDGEGAARESERVYVVDVVRTDLWRTMPVGAALSPKGARDDYVKEIEAMRREKDYFFKEDAESPIPHELRHKLEG